MSRNVALLFCVPLFLSACTSELSSSVSVEDDFLPVEGTLKDTDLVGSLKDCGKPLLSSNIVKDVEYAKLETQDTILAGDINQLKWTEKFAFIYSKCQNHAMMSDTVGKSTRKTGRAGQGPGEIANIHCFTASDSLVFIYPYSRNGSLTVYDTWDNSFVKEFSLKWPIILRWTIDVMGDCLVYYPSTAYLPNNGKTFISAYVANGEGETLMEQIPHLTADVKESLSLDSDPSWLHRGRSNVYSFINDTTYDITRDSIFPCYHLSLGKYKSPSGRYDPTRDYGRGDSALMKDVCETKEYLPFEPRLNKKMWFSRHDKKTEKINSWEQTPFKAYVWYIFDASGITSDIDGSQSFRDFDNVGENCLYLAITPDNLDQVKRNAAKTKVRFSEKQAELLKLLDEMGEDDNPIIAFYKLKD